MAVAPRAAIFFAFLVTACGEGPKPEALLDAAERGDVPALTQLIEDAQGVDVRDACLFTPLMKAASNGHTDVVRRLLPAGADVNAADKGGYTALMFAASNDHAEIMEILIAAGADVNHAESTQGWTALIWAANRGARDAVKTLLAHGADMAIKDHTGLTARDWASRNGDPAILESLGAR